MKKYIPVIILVLCGVGFLAYQLFASKEDSSTKKTNGTSESTTETQENYSSFTFSDSSLEKETIETTSQEMDELDVELLIEKFCSKWLNFENVYERNQAIKPFVTEEYAKENTLDVDPHVQYESRGEIESISQNITNKNSYVILGQEKSKDYVNDFVLVIELSAEQDKITTIDMAYVKKGY